MELITRNLQEVYGKDSLNKLITSGKTITVYWGTAPTGRIHVGYFVPFLKIADFVAAGCKVIILIADLHATLDNLKSSFESVKLRSTYYETIIGITLRTLGVNTDNVQFCRGTSFQLSPEYTLDMYRANTLMTVSKVQHAGAEVVKQTDNPLMSGLLYPTLQALDFEYLKADAFLGGIDQRKICMYSADLLPRLGYKRQQIHLMNPMIPGLSKVSGKTESKMSSSEASTKIDLLDTRKELQKKIGSTYCVERDISDNTLLTCFVKNVLFPIMTMKGITEFNIIRPENYGGNIYYSTYDELECAFIDGRLHPVDLKLGIVDNLDKILEPIRKTMESHAKLIHEAYG